MKFLFKAKTKEGDLKEGIIDAASEDAAISVLQQNELFPIALVKETADNSLEKILLSYYDRVSQKELATFFRQVSILIEARVPIISALEAIREQTTNKFFGKVIQEIINDIENGMSFSRALAKHRNVFSLLSINIIRAGETSGNLKKSIDYVTNNIEKNYILNSRIRAAMMYPSIVLIVFFIIGFLVVSFILPRLTQVIKDLGVDIPWYTKVVIAVGGFMESYWWAVGFVIVGLVGGMIYYLKTPDGRKEWDYIKIKMPVIGPLFRGVYIARFSENLAVLLDGGIPILRALTIVSSVMNNSVYESIILRASEEVKIGGSMSSILEKSAFVPPLVSHMIKIGEDAGQVDSVLVHIAEFYDQETEIAARNLSTLIEPILMIFIGIAVGFMAVAILLPIYNLASQIK
jgi:type IV pilus assembly protein PilC